MDDAYFIQLLGGSGQTVPVKVPAHRAVQVAEQNGAGDNSAWIHILTLLELGQVTSLCLRLLAYVRSKVRSVLCRAVVRYREIGSTGTVPGTQSG